MPLEEPTDSGSSDSARIAIETAVAHLRATLPLLDLAGKGMAAIHVSHALAMLDGTDGALSDDDIATGHLPSR